MAGGYQSIIVNIDIYIRWQDRESSNANFSRTCVGHRRSCSQKRITRLHVVNIIWRGMCTPRRVCGEEYAHQFRTSSHVRFLFECSSESTSGGTAIFISSPLGSSGISSRPVYIQVRPRPQIYDSVYRVAVVSCAWDRRQERFGRPAASWIPEWNSNTL
jgi:hypothetical protein